MNNVQGNFAAVANGDSGAPNIQTAGIANLAVTNGKIASGAITTDKIASGAVSQSDLNTGTASDSDSNINYTGTLVDYVSLTGVSYCMIHAMSASGDTSPRRAVNVGAGDSAPSTGRIYYTASLDTEDLTVYVYHRYIQASPPYNLGDGDIPFFISIRMQDGQITGINAAEDPYWAYHGPTDITAHRFDSASGRGFRRENIALAELYEEGLTLSDIKTNRERMQQFIQQYKRNEFVDIEITQAVKNADMDLQPHRWIDKIKPNEEFILIDPVSDIALELCLLQQQGESIIQLIEDGYLELDNTRIHNRGKPQAIHCHSMKWKLTP